jgi:hypothetical protein
VVFAGISLFPRPAKPTKAEPEAAATDREPTTETLEAIR